MVHPTIEDLRETRREIAAEHDFDPKKLGAYFRKLDREEEEEAEWAGIIGELRALTQQLKEREQVAQTEGMQKLAEDLSRDRARLAGALKRLSRQRGTDAAGAK